MDCILFDGGSVDAGGWRGDIVEDLRDLNILFIVALYYYLFKQRVFRARKAVGGIQVPKPSCLGFSVDGDDEA